MIIAVLDTSCSASFALYDNGRELVVANLPISGRNSDQELTPWIMVQLEKAKVDVSDIEHWVVGTGPGSFSGLRVGIALVKGICLVTKASYQGVSGSFALAYSRINSIVDGQSVGVCFDARRGQLIFASYLKRQDLLVVEHKHQVIIKDDFEKFLASTVCLLTPQGELVKKIIPVSEHEKLITYNCVKAQHLFEAMDKMPKGVGRLDDKNCEPVYVRPAVFVKAKTVKNI